jgi:gliding motility associated protien GldN
MLRSVISAVFIMLLLPIANAQCPHSSQAPSVLGGPYMPETVPTRKVVPYPHLRESDVMWSKRVWRIIDLREKMNQPLYFPLEPTDDRISLFDLIKCSIEEGGLTAYNPGPLLDDDEFRVPYTLSEVRGILVTYDTVSTLELDSEEWIEVIVEDPVETSEIKQYLLKEDWFFDRQRSVMEVRIIGIAPMQEIRGADGDVRGCAPIFWLYFPECRYVLANSMVFNRQNDAQILSFDDVFAKRFFNSYIIKEANVFDRKINEEYQGVDALLEADRVKNGIFLIEHDLWHF